MRMRFKNFTLLFLMGIFGLFTTNLFAQQDATIAPADIRYWIGEGENEVVFIANWNDPDTALAWGYRFTEETLMVKDVLDAITETDYRIGYTANGSWFSDLTFNDGVLNLALVGGWWMFNVNGLTAGNYFDAQPVVNGDVIKFGDESCGIITDPDLWTYVWTKEVAAVYPLADEAMIDPSEILYWIGEGENEAIFAVNFAEPEDVCFAWGYRFPTESVTIQDMMKAIADVDLRFAYTDEPSAWGGYMLTGLTFVYGGITYNLQGYNAMYNVNGLPSWFTFDEQTVLNGDFVKWGDYTIGTEIAPWTYVWETPVRPVTAYDAVSEVNTSMSLYPNPASTFTMLQMGEVNANATVTVTDLQGHVISNFAVNQTREPVRIDTEDLRAGLYFVTVSDGISRQTVKLSVK